jgi:hypothetical protein
LARNKSNQKHRFFLFALLLILFLSGQLKEISRGAVNNAAYCLL